MPTVAKLDRHRILTGFEVVDVVPDSAIVVPDNPDLEPGQYRWNGESFIPIGRAAVVDQLTGTRQAFTAIAAALEALRTQGITLPPETLAWLATFKLARR